MSDPPGLSTLTISASLSNEISSDDDNSLETFNDIGKSIFLITKLYEIIYDRNVAYTNLAKYTSLLNLSKEQRREIADLQKMLTDNDRQFGKTKRIKRIYQKNRSGN